MSLCPEHPWGSLCCVMLLELIMGSCYLHPWDEGTTLPKPGVAVLAQPEDTDTVPCVELVDLGSNTHILVKGRGCFPCILQKNPT